MNSPTGLGPFESIRPDCPDDLFLVCASYEPRSTAVVENLASDYRADTALIYVNKEFLEGPSGTKTQEAMNRMKELLSSHCDKVLIAKGSWLDPKLQLNALKEALGEIESAQNSEEGFVTLDSTTFNRESLIVASTLVAKLFRLCNNRVYYTSPQSHGKWLSRGFRFIRNIMGYSGVQRPEQHTVLVVLSGFESDRTLRLIEEHEPAKVLLGIGNPPSGPDFLSRNELEQRLILARQDVERFDFPVDSTSGCVQCLHELLNGYLGSTNIVIAPMSVKLSTLACMLVAQRYPEIQLSYSLPGEYNTENYSDGVRRIYSEELTF